MDLAHGAAFHPRAVVGHASLAEMQQADAVVMPRVAVAAAASRAWMAERQRQRPS
jgi:hypothetical protein